MLIINRERNGREQKALTHIRILSTNYKCGGINELENHHFATTIVKIDSGKKLNGY